VNDNDLRVLASNRQAFQELPGEKSWTLLRAPPTCAKNPALWAMFPGWRCGGSHRIPKGRWRAPL